MTTKRKRTAQLTVSAENGLHLRPAAMLVMLANRCSSTITFEHKGITANAKSIMNLLMLEAGFGDKLVVIADGDDSEQAISAIHNLFEMKFAVQ